MILYDLFKIKYIIDYQIIFLTKYNIIIIILIILVKIIIIIYNNYKDNTYYLKYFIILYLFIFNIINIYISKGYILFN